MLAFADPTDPGSISAASAGLSGHRRDLRSAPEAELGTDVGPLVLGATWGLIACRVPPSARDGVDQGRRARHGMDLRHFGLCWTASRRLSANRSRICTATALTASAPRAGRRRPAGATPRCGIAYRASIFAGKVFIQLGKRLDGRHPRGMNWARRRGARDLVSLGAQHGEPATPPLVRPLTRAC